MKKDIEEYGSQAVSNGGSENFPGSKISYLLASKDRDYLVTSAGAQVLTSPLISLSLSYVIFGFWRFLQEVKLSDIEGKVIGLYFAANWYPPCFNFTQLLVDIYKQLKSNSSKFEIVYVSSDEDSDAFDSYHSCMPWPAVPFSDLEIKKALNRKYDVEGIPCLVILQPHDYNKEAATHNGVELIQRYGVQAYPFTKERLEQLEKEERELHEKQTLTNLLTNHDRDYILGHSGLGEQVLPVYSLIGKTIGLYFSAQWCVPCVKFTPKLISIYRKIKQMIATKGEDFEIVFVSSDRDQSSFDSYFSTMPWLALPFGDPSIKDLAKYFDVQGIPCLVILGPDGKTVTKRGRNLINWHKEDAYPFTEAQLDLLEAQLNEEAKSLPKSVSYEGHRHDLKLVSEGNGGGPFICCVCDEQGSSWAYQCLECGYEIHTKCVKAQDRQSEPVAT